MYVATLLLFVGYFLSRVDLEVPWNYLLLLLVVLLVKLLNKSLSRNEEKHNILQVDQVTSRTYIDDGWLNKIIAQFWPHVMKHITAQITNDQVHEILEKYNVGGDFKLQRFTLGSRPLHIRGIEVQWSFPERREVVLHVDIQYNSECNITFTWLGIVGSIHDFQVRGRAKVVLGPIFDSPPFVSNFLVKFLQKPNVGYRLSGIAVFLPLCGFKNKLEDYLTTKIIRFGDIRNNTSIYGKRTTKLADSQKADHKSNAVTSWYLSLFSTVISMIELFQWLSYFIFAWHILSLLEFV